MEELLTVEGRAAAWLPILDTHVSSLMNRSGMDPSEWRAAGRVTAETPYKEDLAYWMEEGLKQAEAYTRWLEQSGWKFATMPDGKPGIEWEAEVSFGGTAIKMVVDAIYDVNGQWVVVDYKTGKWTPEKILQLSLYASALERIYGRRPKWGAYFMTRKASLAPLTELNEYGMDYFDREFAAMNAAIANDEYTPNVGKHCSYCGVKDFCAALNGPQSHNYPLITPKEKTA